MLSQFVSRVRRNHGLEHATIHMLTAAHANFSAQGNSDHRGFYLNVYGEISESNVETAVNEAYRRLQAGEHQLAVHPNCGTVMITMATMSALAAQAAFGIEQRRQKRSAFSPSVLFNGLPAAVLAVIVALIVSRPLGIKLQANYTVEGEMGDLQVKNIRRVRPSPVTRVFQLLLTGGKQNQQTAAYRIETQFSNE